METSDLYKRGLEIRTRVLGKKHVSSQLEEPNDFKTPIQELVIEYCWGKIWTRPELDLRTRSLINVAMLTALGRERELALHIRGAKNNGCTEVEIREVLLQSAIYCGVPAALSAFAVAEQVLAGNQ